MSRLHRFLVSPPAETMSCLLSSVRNGSMCGTFCNWSEFCVYAAASWSLNSQLICEQPLLQRLWENTDNITTVQVKTIKNSDNFVHPGDSMETQVSLHICAEQAVNIELVLPTLQNSMSPSLTREKKLIINNLLWLWRCLHVTCAADLSDSISCRLSSESEQSGWNRPSQTK